MGQSSAIKASQDVLNNKRIARSKLQKPLDSLVCAVGIKSVAKVSSMREAFDPKKVNIC
jgi:hypothetical protein